MSRLIDIAVYCRTESGDEYLNVVAVNPHLNKPVVSQIFDELRGYMGSELAWVHKLMVQVGSNEGSMEWDSTSIQRDLRTLIDLMYGSDDE